MLGFKESIEENLRKLREYFTLFLTQNNLDIVVGNRQLFLPSILLVVGKEKPEPVKEPEKVPALFQLMVLYHLERNNLDGSTMQSIADMLKTSYATVNRCVRWMKEKGFITLKIGRASCRERV